MIELRFSQNVVPRCIPGIDLIVVRLYLLRQCPGPWNIGIANQYFCCVGTKTEEIPDQKNTAYIHMKPMRERPKDIQEIDSGSLNTVHFILTAWKKQYHLTHPRYFKIFYSSHSSYKEL